MKKILAAMMIIAAFTGISHADILYTTSEGSLGVIPVGNSTSTTSVDVPTLMYSHLGSDAIAGSYSVGTNHYVMVVDRRPDNISGDMALIFTSSNLESPVNSADLEGVNSTMSVERMVSAGTVMPADMPRKMVLSNSTAINMP